MWYHPTDSTTYVPECHTRGVHLQTTVRQDLAGCRAPAALKSGTSYYTLGLQPPFIYLRLFHPENYMLISLVENRQKSDFVRNI